MTTLLFAPLVMISMMSEMELKMAIFGAILSGNEDAVDPKDSQVMVYR